MTDSLSLPTKRSEIGRDYQRQAVYTLEVSYFGEDFTRRQLLDEDEAQELAIDVVACFTDLDAPLVSHNPRRTRTSSMSFPSKSKFDAGVRPDIRLGTWGLNPLTVIHETCHYLQLVPEIWPDVSDRFPWHGPGFLALEARALAHYGLVDCPEDYIRGGLVLRVDALPHAYRPKAIRRPTAYGRGLATAKKWIVDEYRNKKDWRKAASERS